MTRPTPKAHDLVSEQRMVQLMSQWAQAADASITAKLVELEERLRAEYDDRLAALRSDLSLEICQVTDPSAHN